MPALRWHALHGAPAGSEAQMEEALAFVVSCGTGADELAAWLRG